MEGLPAGGRKRNRIIGEIMNETQRQILSDRLNEIAFQIENLQNSISQREGELERKRSRLAELLKEQSELSEGIDW